VRRVRVGSEGEEEPRVGLVGGLVAAEPRVAVDAKEQAARGMRVGGEMRADRPEPGADRGDEAQQRVAHLGEVAVLVLVEPLAIVVAPELAEEAKEIASDGRRRRRKAR